jgi:hypothetical protein
LVQAQKAKHLAVLLSCSLSDKTLIKNGLKNWPKMKKVQQRNDK